MFVAIVTDEILGLDIIHAHDACVDLRHHVLQLGNKEVSLWPLGHDCFQPSCMKGNSKVTMAWCDRVAAVLLDTWRLWIFLQGRAARPLIKLK
jgi:hypothetical protein